MRVTMVPIPDFYDTGYKSWSHSMTNISIPEVNMLKNSLTLAVSVAINVSTNLGFVSVNGHRETYFVDTLSMLLSHLHNTTVKNSVSKS